MCIGSISEMLISQVAQVREYHLPKGRLLTIASDGWCHTLEYRYRTKSREVKRSVHRDKKEFVIVLIREMSPQPPTWGK